MAKRNNKLENEYAQFSKMSPEFVHLTGESLKQQIGGLENKVANLSAQIENLSAEIETLSNSDKEEDKKAAEAKTAKKESLSKVLEAAIKEKDEQKPKLEKKLARVQGFEKNKVQIERIKQIKSMLCSKKTQLETEYSYNEKKISELNEQIAELDNDSNNKSDREELEKMEKADVKFFYAEDFKRLDELKEKVAIVDAKKKSITDKISSIKNANKEIEKKIEKVDTEISKCDFAWKNLFSNKTWDEIEAKSMDGRFTKKQEKSKEAEKEKKAEEPSKEEPKTPAEEQTAAEEQKQEATAEEKPSVVKQAGDFIKGSYEKAKSIINEKQEEMWTDLQTEEEAKKEEAENAEKEETGLTKTSRWSKILNAIKHPIQTIKNARAAKVAKEEKINFTLEPIETEKLEMNDNSGKAAEANEPAQTEEQKADAFIAKLRKMAEAEEAKQAKANSQEKPDYSKYVARHARNVEKQKDDEGR